MTKTLRKITAIMTMLALVLTTFGSLSTALAAGPNDPTTLPATGITTSDATLNGVNGVSDAVGHSFWASLAPFDTSSPVLPPGAYSTPDMGPIASTTPFSAQLSSVNGLPAVTPNTTYYYAAWSNVGGTWSPGQVLTFTTAPEIATSTATTSVVTIQKYVDGAPATAVTADNADFQMNATYTINGTPGTGQYALSETGYNNDPTPYQAKTSDLPLGSDYGTSEIMDSVVGATNSSSTPFSLVGYTTGNSLAEAAAASPTPTAPNFTNIQSDKYVIVWNQSFQETAPTSTASSTEKVTVTINKFINGQQATASSSNNHAFQMNAVYNSQETGPGTGTYSLAANNPVPYEAETIEFTQGADYSTNEIIDGTVVGASCTASTTPYELVGYTTGNSKAEAMSATPASTTPTFINLTSNKYVIVWNKSCSTAGGTIGGDVTGGVSTSTQGTLAVTSIDAVKTTSVANGTYEDGWIYVFNITTPNNEEDLSMKFADWLNNSGSSTIPVANNMRISSAQANNGGATVTVTAANTYTTPPLHMVTDLDPSLVGRQVQVKVEVKIPSTTVNGSYSTSYGVKTI